MRHILRMIFYAMYFSFVISFVACPSPTGGRKSSDQNIMLTEEKWLEILHDIAEKNEMVDLDLSAYLRSESNEGGGLRSDGTFDPMQNGISIASEGKAKIRSLILPDAATAIIGKDPTVFSQFDSLKTVTGRNITQIGSFAFGFNPPNYLVLESVDFPNAIYIGKAAFMNNRLTQAHFPLVTVIGDNAFNGCDLLESAYFPEAVTVEMFAFADCIILENIYMPKAEEIGRVAFAIFIPGNNAKMSPETNITLGKEAPKLDVGIFDVFNTDRSVIVNVPEGATGYGNSVSGTNSTVCWGNGLRGPGWNGAAFTGNPLNINPRISVSIVEKP